MTGVTIDLDQNKNKDLTIEDFKEGVLCLSRSSTNNHPRQERKEKRFCKINKLDIFSGKAGWINHESVSGL